MEAVENAVSDKPDYSLVVVGHSLGGAIATFAAAQLRNAGYSAALVCEILFFIDLPNRRNVLLVLFVTRHESETCVLKIRW